MTAVDCDGGRRRGESRFETKKTEGATYAAFFSSFLKKLFITQIDYTQELHK